MVDLISDYVVDNNIVITSAAGKGSSSLTLFLINELSKNHSCLYYNPSGNIDPEFVLQYYPSVANKVIFLISPVKDFFDLICSSTDFDYVVIDPGDTILSIKNILIPLNRVLQSSRCKLICTSQIRVDISQGGRVYSTLEKSYGKTSIFKYFIWITDVSETSILYYRRYVDVYDKPRIGNQFISRYIFNFSKEGSVVA